MKFMKVILFILIADAILINCLQDGQHEKYPGDGDWIYFPDENEEPRKLYIMEEVPSFESRFFKADYNDVVTFTLYTRNSINNGQILTFDNETLLKSDIDFNKHTKFITHGWYSSGNSSTCITIKNNYLKYYDYNVIIVDWSPIADFIFYPVPMYKTSDMAEHYAKFVNFLINHGLKTDNLHLIGHSLGAHISGFVGDIIGNQSIQRITGLDPAQPGFVTNVLTSGKISANHAKFVDVIHSCGGVLGLYERLGDVDFYPNGGMPPQPGCAEVTQIFSGCSHGRSWKYFAESIIPESIFLAKKCDSWTNFENKNCNNETTLMGDRVSITAKGSYYLITNGEEPFATYDSSENEI